MKRFWILVSILWLATCGGGGSSPTEPEPPKLPTITNLDLETAEDTALNFTLQGTEPSGLSLTYAFSSTPSNGQVTLNGAQATYNPNANYNGTDTFGYIATSTSGSSTVGVISITITPVDDEPSTMDANATTDEDNAVDITFDVTEVDGQNVTFSVTNNPSNGSVAISGSVATYTPNQDWNGTDQFNFQVEDASAKRILNTATATIIVNPVNDAPIANNVTVEMDEENKLANRYQPLNITLDGTDVDGDNLSYTIADNPSNGTLQADGTATVIYTPNQGYNGVDTFTYKVNDGILESDSATVTISINAVNDAPTVDDIDVGELNIKFPIDIELIGSDSENDNLTFSIINQPSKGNVSINDNIATYTATEGGEDTFTFQANDGTNNSNIGVVNIDNYITFGSSGEERARSVQESYDGGYILAGYSSSNSSYGSSYLVKTDLSGNEEWTNFFEFPPQGSFGYSVQKTSDGGYILAGVNNLNAKKWLFLVKTDASGSEEWRQTFGGIGNDSACSVQEAADGGYVLSGTHTSRDASGDMFLVKTDASGNMNFTQRFGTDGESDRASSIQNTTDGGYIIAGTTTSYGSGGNDMYVVKTNASGVEEWSQTFGGVGDDTAFSIQNTTDGGYIIAGTTTSYGSGGNDMYVVKTNASGSEEWSQTFGGVGDDTAYSIEKTSDGGYILGGSTTSIGSNDNDIYVVKTDASGSEEWRQTFGGRVGSIGNGESIARETSDGGYVIVGIFINDATGGGTEKDMLLIKTDSEGNRIF